MPHGANKIRQRVNFPTQDQGFFTLNQIRVLIADDHALIRGGIRAHLDNLPEFQIVAEAGDGHEALRLIGKHQPDVALIECAMSRLNGFEVTSRAAKESPKVRVIILSTNANEGYLRRAMECGAAGYLTMNTSVSELEFAIKTIADGKTHISSSATRLLLDSVVGRAGNGTSEHLTRRQSEVLRLIAEGNTTKQIGLLLNISAKTVETHRRLLMESLNIHDVAGLVHYAIKTGLIRLEEQ